MTHRYLATGVGVLITVMALASWAIARRGAAALSPWWATLTLVWVCLQGLFGALTVTMKLYPAIVTLHLLGGMGLLALLAGMGAALRGEPLELPAPLRAGCMALAVLVVLQIALGGWVSTNYAVLACSDFPMCQGSWWPAMDFEHAFTLLRELGAGKDGGFLPFAALTAIHYVHRLGAYVVLAVLGMLAWQLHASGDPALRRWGWRLAAVALWQVASGVGNVVLGWPLWAAVAHTGGAGALVVLLSVMIVRARQARGAAAPTGSARTGMRVAS
jgi:cytochrome c oxidase assembly protein subunit 15